MENSGVFPGTACPSAPSAFGGPTGVSHVLRHASLPSLPLKHISSFIQCCQPPARWWSRSAAPQRLAPVFCSSCKPSPAQCPDAPSKCEWAHSPTSAALCFLGHGRPSTPNKHSLVCLHPHPLQGEGRLTFPNTACPGPSSRHRPHFHVQPWGPQSSCSPCFRTSIHHLVAPHTPS